VPPVQDSAYYAARPKLAIPKNDAIHAGDDDLYFHPSVRGFADLVDNGEACVIHGVGYQRPNRSHFESMDIWHSCLRKDDNREFGWLGKFLDASVSALGDVPAIHFGEKKQPFALTARDVRVPSVRSIDEFRLKSSQADELSTLLENLSPATNPNTPNSLLDFVQSSTASAIDASQRVTAAREIKGDKSTTSGYPDSQLAQRLSVIAQLIRAELATNIYYVELDGFDTHAQQLGAHTSLLGQWSNALSAFIKDLKEHGHFDRVSVLTFSEFGRRVAENASEGTDHGAAAPIFLAGGGLRTSVIGTQPSLTDLHDGDLKYSIDFRSVYGAVLCDWLKVTDASSIVGVEDYVNLYSGKV
ncbi:MAG: DUF1501 domain-containing protein, partial [Planctomycetota bacterium]